MAQIFLLPTPSSSTTTTANGSTPSSTAIASPTSPTRAQTEARAAVLASLTSAGAHHDTHLQQRAADLHANALAISRQETELAQHTAALARESAKWDKEAAKATHGLKQVGDLQNWAEMLERDFLVLEETLRVVDGEDEVESGSGGSRWRAA